MPRIGTYYVPVFLDPIPVEIPRPVEILERPGMSAASVLFHAKKFKPLVINTVSTAPDKMSAYNLADKYLRTIRSRLTFDDDLVKAPGTVVLAVRSTFADVGLCIGGNAAGDRWEINTSWTVLFDADLDTR